MRPYPAVVLDTDVLSFIFNDDEVRQARYRGHFEGKVVAIAFVSVAEMLFGLAAVAGAPRGWRACGHS